MTAGYRWDEYNDAQAYWYTGALVTSAKLHAMTVNADVIFDVVQGGTPSAGLKNFTLTVGAGYETIPIVFNSDNQLASGSGSGAPNYSATPVYFDWETFFDADVGSTYDADPRTAKPSQVLPKTSTFIHSLSATGVSIMIPAGGTGLGVGDDVYILWRALGVGSLS